MRNSFNQTLKNATAPTINRGIKTAFFQKLALGTLEKTHYQNYLAQDYFYLLEYTRILTLVAHKAPTASEKIFLLALAECCLQEPAFHENFSAEEKEKILPHCASKKYISFLKKHSTQTYEEAIACLIACMHSYLEISHILNPHDKKNPYQYFFDSYTNKKFLELYQKFENILKDQYEKSENEKKEKLLSLVKKGAEFDIDFIEASDKPYVRI